MCFLCPPCLRGDADGLGPAHRNLPSSYIQAGQVHTWGTSPRPQLHNPLGGSDGEEAVPLVTTSLVRAIAQDLGAGI